MNDVEINMRDAGQRTVWAALLSIAILALCWPTVRAVSNLGIHDDRYVQIIAAPFLFAFLAYWERRHIFREMAWSPRVGITLLLLVFVAYFSFLRGRDYPADSPGLFLAAAAVILAGMAAFILCYGLRSFRAALFPLCCLALMIPVPHSLMDQLTVGLEHASATTSYQMLRLAGVPVFAQGMILSLPGLTINVAPECSGIHSCLALAIVGLLASRVFLRNGWNRLALVTATFPIAIFKNAIRISVLAWFGAYVDRAVLFGPLHRRSGLVFGPIAVILLVLLLGALQKSETWVATRRQGAHIIPAGSA